jgi:hypothetical protein
MHSHFNVRFPESSTDLELALVRTHLVDESDESASPPAIGFPYRYNFYADGERLVVSMTERHEPFCVALTNINKHAPVAVKVIAGGVNLISRKKEKPDAYQNLCTNDATGKGQNFVEVTEHQSVYGIRINGSTVSQLMATPIKTSRQYPDWREPIFGHIEFIIIPTLPVVAHKRLMDIYFPSTSNEDMLAQLAAWKQSYNNDSVINYRRIFWEIPARERQLNKALAVLDPNLFIVLDARKQLLNSKKHNKYPLSPSERELAATLNLPAPPHKPATTDLREQRETTKYTSIMHYASDPFSTKTEIIEEKPEPYAGQIPWQEVPYIQEMNDKGVKIAQTTRLAELKKYNPTLFKEGVHGGRAINHDLTPSTQPITDYDLSAVKYIKICFVRQNEVKVHAKLKTFTGVNPLVTPLSRISFWNDSLQRLRSIPDEEYERCIDEERVRKEEDDIRERLAVPLIGAGLSTPTRHYGR